MRVESPIMQMLGVAPLLGRVFDGNDDRPEAESGLLLSFATWRSVFGGDPDILGRRVALDGTAYAVIGVMPAGFAFPTPQTQFWTLNRDLAAAAAGRANPPRRGGTCWRALRMESRSRRPPRKSTPSSARCPADGPA